MCPPGRGQCGSNGNRPKAGAHRDERMGPEFGKADFGFRRKQPVDVDSRLHQKMYGSHWYPVCGCEKGGIHQSLAGEVLCCKRDYLARNFSNRKDFSSSIWLWLSFTH